MGRESKDESTRSISSHETENSNFGYAPGEPHNLCSVCKEDLGPQNPRQLCGKFYCPLQLQYVDDDGNSISLSPGQVCESCSLIQSSQSRSSQSQSAISSQTSKQSLDTQNQPTQPIDLSSSPFPSSESSAQHPANVNPEKLFAQHDIRFFFKSSDSRT